MNSGLESADKRQERNQLFAKVFGGKAGKEILRVLREITIERPVAKPQQEASYAYFREGQNDIVRQIEAAVEAGKQGR